MFKYLNIQAIISGFVAGFIVDFALNSILSSFGSYSNIYWYIAMVFGGIVSGYIAKRNGLLNGIIAMTLLCLLPFGAGLYASYSSYVSATSAYKKSALDLLRLELSPVTIFNNIILSGILGGVGGIIGGWISSEQRLL